MSENNIYKDNFWQMFTEEMGELIEKIEHLLVDADSLESDVENIRKLFRNFHTIKSLAKTMDLNGIESITHKTEDILAIVREGKAKLDSDLVDLMLESLDSLKSLKNESTKSKQDVPAPISLLNKLDERYKLITGSADEKQDINSHDNNDDDYNYECFAECTSEKIEIYDDIELLKFYCSKIEKDIKSLSYLLDSDFKIDTKEFKKVLQTLGKFHLASDKIGFKNIAHKITVLESFLKAIDITKCDYKQELINKLSDLIDLFNFIEKESEIVCGVEDFKLAIYDFIKKDTEIILNRTISEFNITLNNIEPLNESKNLDELIILKEHINELKSLFKIINIKSGLKLINFISLITSEWEYKERPVFEETIELIINSIYTLQQILKTNDIKQKEKLEINSAESIIDLKRKLYLYSEKKGKESVCHNLMKIVSNNFNISNEIKEILSFNNLQTLYDCTENKKYVCEIQADLDAAKDIGLNFVEWIKRNADIISNRIVFADFTTSYCALYDSKFYKFLLVFEISEQQVKMKLGELDPSVEIFKIKKCCKYIPYTELKEKSEIKSKEQFNESAEAGLSTDVIRIKGENLDKFLNQIGEMVMLRGMLAHALYDETLSNSINTIAVFLKNHNNAGSNGNSIYKHLENIKSHHQKLIQSESAFQTVLSRLQEAVMELRVVPVGLVFRRFPRLVRDLSKSMGKSITMNTEGEEVKIDKGMVDLLVEPIMHIVRNALDHGIEIPEERKKAGKDENAEIKLCASQKGSKIYIEISDDGRGINSEKIREKAVKNGLLKEEESHKLSENQLYEYIFYSGFSTADKVTETSGRGVGMDVVKSKIADLRGQITVKSELSVGTTFIIELPLSVAIQEVLLIKTGNQTLAIPDRFILEVIESTSCDIQSVKCQQAILLRDTFLPVYDLAELLGFKTSTKIQKNFEVVVISNGKNKIGLIVDKMLFRQELFIKDINHQLISLPGFGGASILGNGKVVIIIDCDEILYLAENRIINPGSGPNFNEQKNTNSVTAA